MTKLFMFEKPLGMRDTFPDLYEIKETNDETTMDVCFHHDWGGTGPFPI